MTLKHSVPIEADEWDGYYDKNCEILKALEIISRQIDDLKKKLDKAE